MTNFRIVFTGSSKKDLDKLDNVIRQRIAKKLQYFLEQDDPLGYARKLVDTKIGSYRFRVGHYRIVFDVDGDTLQVVSIMHRKEIYRG
jgi:mRNA interferase RelE/StbE